MNLWSRFRGLFARDNAITVVTVLADNGNGTSTVQTASSDPYVVIGTSVAPASKALVQGGKIIGAAADLPSYDVTIF